MHREMDEWKPQGQLHCNEQLLEMLLANENMT